MPQPDPIQPPALDWDAEFARLDAKGARPKGAEVQSPLQQAAAGEPPAGDGGGGDEPAGPVVSFHWYGTGHRGDNSAGSAGIDFYEMPTASVLIALTTAIGQQLRAPEPG